jgi:hypothetical protein
MTRVNLLAGALFVTLTVIICSHQALSQKKNPQTIYTQQVPRTGEFSFLDGQGRLGETGILRCGPASINTVSGSPGNTNKIDVSFGVIPADERITNGKATIFGSWNVRSIFPAVGTRPETISSYFFDGSFIHGTILNARGGGQVFDLYGTTNFIGSMCNVNADYTTRRPVHIYGICGNDQEVNFEVLTRLPATVNGIINLDGRTVFASGIFRGNISCGRTTDRTRVRTNLSR